MLQTSMSMSVPKIAIVTDSTSDLAPEMIKEFGIEIIPLHVVYKDREYLDGVLEAARKLRNSTDFQGVVNVAKTVSQHIKLYFVLSTLEYLKRGGRIGYVSGTIGELLNIKPIISVNSEGKYITSAKVRGRDQSLKKLYDILIENTQEGRYNVAIVHGGAEQEARNLWQKARELPNINDLLFNQISPVMGVHTGPGLVGIIISPVIATQS